jgi:hypothetical protein
MKKLKKGLVAKQSSEVANLILVRYNKRSFWSYHYNYDYSRSYRTMDEAITDAFSNGFDRVRLLNGKVLKKKTV